MGSKLKISSSLMDGVYIIEPEISTDNRGSFARVFCELELRNIFKESRIRQINHSVTTKKGTVRGMHFQYPPNCEIKLVKCIRGKVLDVIIDIRRNSPTFLQAHYAELSSTNNKILYIPEGFAHGFQALKNDSELVYFHSQLYSPDNESALNVRDPLLDIKWPLDIADLSERDKAHDFLDSSFTGIEI